MWPVWQSIHTKYLEKSYRVLSHTVQNHTCYEVTPQPPTALTASGTLLIFASLLALYLAKCVHATSILCYEMIFLLRSHTAISYGYDCIGDAVDLCLSSCSIPCQMRPRNLNSLLWDDLPATKSHRNLLRHRAMTASGTLLIFASLLAPYLAKCVHATSILCFEMIFLFMSL